MNELLTKEGLQAIAANYRQQQQDNIQNAAKAAGAALAIEHLIEKAYPTPAAAEPPAAS